MCVYVEHDIPFPIYNTCRAVNNTSLDETPGSVTYVCCRFFSIEIFDKLGSFVAVPLWAVFNGFHDVYAGVSKP